MKLGVGDLIGPYRIVAWLGAGAMGEVYRAHDSRLSRDVAIKILPDHIAADPDMVGRFEREVRAIAALSHPNVLGIHDVGQRGELIYAVMEFIPGVTLRERMAAGPFTPVAIIDVARQIASGLAAAHAKQIVHRDLKPDNVLVDESGHVKILDFGLAKIAPLGRMGAELETQLATSSGLVVGTLAYMAPEQARGVDVDHRADIFSFGAMLFEMVTGRPPFLRATPAETIAALLSVEAVDPAAVSAMPPLLGRLVSQCLVKPVADRLNSLGDVAETLGGHAGAMAAPIAASVPAASVLRSIAVLPFADMTVAKDHDYFCEGMADEISSALARVAGLRVVARTSAFRFKNRTDDVRDIGRALGVDTILEGSVRVAGQRMRVTAQMVSAADGYQVWSERFDRETTDVFAIQDEIAATVCRLLTPVVTPPAGASERSADVRLPIAGAFIEQTARPASLEAYTAYLRGRHHWNRRTEVGLERSVECFRESLDVDPHYAPAWAGVADSNVMLALYGVKSPAEVMPLARDAAEAALALSPALAGAHSSLACVMALYDWAWEQADASFARALAIDPNLATAWQWRAMHVWLPRGRFDEAAAALSRAVDLDPISPAIGASLGLHAFFAGDLDRSLAHLDRGLELDPTVPLLHFFRGMTLTELDRSHEGLASLARALEFGGRRPEVVAALAQAHAKAGDPVRATAARDELQVLAATRFVSPATIAQVHVALGDTSRALAELERAAEVRATDLVWLNVRPSFRTLRAEPRFQALVARLAL